MTDTIIPDALDAAAQVLPHGHAFWSGPHTDLTAFPPYGLIAHDYGVTYYTVTDGYAGHGYCYQTGNRRNNWLAGVRVGAAERCVPEGGREFRDGAYVGWMLAVLAEAGGETA